MVTLLRFPLSRFTRGGSLLRLGDGSALVIGSHDAFMKNIMDSLLPLLVITVVWIVIFFILGALASRYVYDLVFSLIFILIGFLYAFKSLRAVRARVHSGKGTAEDLKKLRWNQYAGWCFIAYGTISGLLHAMRFL